MSDRGTKCAIVRGVTELLVELGGRQRPSARGGHLRVVPHPSGSTELGEQLRSVVGFVVPDSLLESAKARICV